VSAFANNDIDANLYLEECGNRYKLVMPDQYGAFDDTVMRKRTGLAIKWPVNPHWTGEGQILESLNSGARREHLGREVFCPGFAADQDGRFYKQY